MRTSYSNLATQTRYSLLLIRGLLVSCLLCMAWQAIVTLAHLPSYILPSPLSVGQSLHHNFALLLANFYPTLVETVVGLALGITIGVLLALSMATLRFVSFWLLPVLIISQAIPTFAIAPLLVLWLGYGISSKVVTVAFMLFFPVASATYEGLKRTPDMWLDMAKTMNGHSLRVLWNLRIPAARAHFADGVKIATVFAPMGAIISEWVGASRGLGFLMLTANARLETDLVIACLVILVILSLSLYGLVTYLLRFID